MRNNHDFSHGSSLTPFEEKMAASPTTTPPGHLEHGGPAPIHEWHFPRSVGIEDASSDAGPVSSEPVQNISLWEQLLSPENIAAAWDRVRNNQGAAGIDGITIRHLTPCFEREWEAVNAALCSGNWQPQPLRRVSVPKASGGVRHLGIPTVMDRVIHQAFAQVLTPFWESRFSSHSFAYRRGLGVREALLSLASQAHAYGTDSAWHLDIRDFFDSVPRPQAIRVVQRATEEKEPLELTRAILNAGVFTGGRILPAPSGIPQGSPLSPLLANGVLHDFDLWLVEQSLPFVRYADDIVILLPPGHTPARWQPAVAQQLALLGLELNETKTTHGPLNGLNFLGFSFFMDHRGVWRRRISPSSWAALEAELQRRGNLAFVLDGREQGSPEDYFTGWLSHFGCTECPLDKERLDNFSAIFRQKNPRPSCKVKVPYDGTPGTFAFRSASLLPAAPGWWRTLQLWMARAVARRWVCIDLDWGRGKRGLPLRGLRLVIGPFNFRFRL